MKVFIWKTHDNMTHNYHSEGGAVAIAETLDEARLMLAKDSSIYGSIEGLAFMTLDPDIVVDAPLFTGEKYAEIFPDAGCC